MKILKKVINRKKKIFAIKVNLDEHTDDLWNIYNLMDIGDQVTGTCHRKIKWTTGTIEKQEKKVIHCTL